jgi:hypothetical protein
MNANNKDAFICVYSRSFADPISYAPTQMVRIAHPTGCMEGSFLPQMNANKDANVRKCLVRGDQALMNQLDHILTPVN